MNKIKLDSLCTKTNSLDDERYEFRYSYFGGSSGVSTTNIDSLLMSAQSALTSGVIDTSKGLELELTGRFSKDVLEKIDFVFYDFYKSTGVDIKYLRNYTLE